MNRISAILGWKYVYWGLGAVILVLGGIFFFGNNGDKQATIVVSRADFINQVSVSGKVITASEADLGFASSGRIGGIGAKSGDSVKAGQLLAQLEIGDLLADLKIKEINSQKGNTEVESAYRKLLTDGLELIPDSASYTMDVPEITGIYDGAEGTYKVRIIQKNISLSDVTILTFGLERSERIIDEEEPTPLGNRGLYVSFPDDPELYRDTTWYLEIPNKASSSYLANYNAYNEAKAEFENEKLLTEENGGASSVAQAEVDKIRAEIRKSTIYAPFDGLVTNVEKETGETVSQNEAVVSMIGGGFFQIESFVPEVNIALIELGHVAEVTLDAYGGKEFFSTTVISIDPAETVRDGVSTYKVVLQFKEKDSRIKAGMTANVSIVIFNKPDAIAVPGGVIFEKDGKNFIKVKRDNTVEDREVMLGAVSSLGQVEIVSGLEAGEEIVLSPDATPSE